MQLARDVGCFSESRKMKKYVSGLERLGARKLGWRAINLEQF
jgi:hypothetical protein